MLLFDTVILLVCDCCDVLISNAVCVVFTIIVFVVTETFLHFIIECIMIYNMYATWKCRFVLVLCHHIDDVLLYLCGYYVCFVYCCTVDVYCCTVLCVVLCIAIGNVVLYVCLHILLLYVIMCIIYLFDLY